MRDPYEVLSVDRKASAADIKSAFRRLAKKLHPDANKNDPKAASRFAEINAAYEILGEADKRKAFDRGEIDAEGKPKFRGFEGFGGGGGPQPGAGVVLGPKRSSRLSASARRVLPATRGVAAQVGAAVRATAAALKISSEKPSAAAGARRGGAGAAFEGEDFAAAPGANVTAALTVTLPDAAHGRDPTHAPAERQGPRSQDSCRHRQWSANTAPRPRHAGAGRRRRRVDHGFDRSAFDFYA